MDWKRRLAYITGSVDEEVEGPFHHERPLKGKGNAIVFPLAGEDRAREGPVACRERLGGLLKYYYRKAG